MEKHPLGNTVSVISDTTNTVVATVTVQLGPSGCAYDSGKGEVFVANWENNSVSVISDATNTVVANVTVGYDPYSLVYDPTHGQVFVTNYGDNTLESFRIPPTPKLQQYPSGHVQHSWRMTLPKAKY